MDDRDNIIRTVMGEVDPNDPDEGRAAVAHVILNRVRAAQSDPARAKIYGGTTPSEIVHARGQFEPWMTRARELLHYDPNSPEYKHVGEIVDGVLAGDIPDPTGGATHFLDPGVVARRPGGISKIAPWAMGQPLAQIGGHAFYAPEGAVPPDDASAAIARAIGAPSGGQSSALAFDDPDSALRARYGIGQDAKDTKAVDPDAALRARYGIAGGKTAPAPAPAAAASAPPPDAIPRVPTADDPRTWQTKEEAAQGVKNAQDFQAENTFVSRLNAATDPAKTSAAVDQAIADAYHSGVALMASGREDMNAGKYLPTFPGSDPSTWTAGGPLKVVAGALGAATSPISGAVKAGIEDPVMQLTANPKAGEVAGAITQFALPLPKALASANKLRPSTEALDKIVEAIGPENAAEAAARLKSNPRLSAADISPEVRTLAQGQAATPGPQQAVLEQSRLARVTGSKSAVNDAYDAAGGKVPNVKTLIDKIKQDARNVGKTEIEPAIANAGPVEITNIISDIDKGIGPIALKNLKAGTPTTALTNEQQMLWDLRRKLRGDLEDRDQMFMDPDAAHDIQSGLRVQAETLRNSGDPSRYLAGTIGDVRQKLVDAIDAASNGKYKPALASYADEKSIEAAFEKGQTAFRNSKLEDRPEFWQDWWDNASSGERSAAKVGARVAVDQQIGAARNAARRGEAIPEADFNQQKLGILFGKTNTDRLVRALQDERDIADTNSKLFQGSQTAQRLRGADALKIRDVHPVSGGLFPTAAGAEAVGYMTGGVPGMGAAAVLGGSAVRKGIQYLGQMKDQARNTVFSKLALATGPERQAIIDRLEALSGPNAPGRPNKLLDLIGYGALGSNVARLPPPGQQ